MFIIRGDLQANTGEWIMSALSAYGLFVAACDGLDKRIEALSVDRQKYYLGTDKLMGEVCNLIEKKNRIINLKVICDKVRDALPPVLWQALYDRYVENDSADAAADRFGVSKSTVLNRIRKGLRQAVVILKESGFDADYFEREFGADKQWLQQALVTRV